MRTDDTNKYQDMELICTAPFIPWGELEGKTILITGATGLIGYALTCALLYANQHKGLRMTVLALVRDEARAKERFAPWLEAENGLRLVLGTVEQLPDIEGPVDYIVHGASQTASKAFVRQPVETIYTAIQGTSRILELARGKQSKGVVYLSSMEVYGHPPKGHRVTEDEIGSLTPLDVRNSYPISKQQCESLCCAYAQEYGVPVTIARLTQTFGPDFHENDTRVFAQFRRCVMEKRDIVLFTKGETERSYLHASDAATALLVLLLKGQPGQAYNIADESTYGSIADMAQKIAQEGGVQVRFELKDETELGYPKPVYMDLDTARLKALGWTPGYSMGDD